MIDAADEYGFPLLELPQETYFSHIIHSILGEILNTQATYLNQSEQAHQFFVEIILKGGGFEAIAEALSQLIGNSVAILDEKKAILAQGVLKDSPDNLEILLAKRAGQAKMTIDPLGSGVTYVKTCLSGEDPFYEYRTSINVYNNTFGYLVFWDNNRTIKPRDFISIERAVIVAALRLLNEKSLREVERRYRNEFIDDLIYSSRIDETSLKERAKHLGWKLDNNYVAFVVDIDNFLSYADKVKGDEVTIQKTKDQLFRIIQDNITEKDVIIGTKSDTIIMLVPQVQNLSNQQIKTRCISKGKKIISGTNKIIRHFTVSIGVGRLHQGITGLRKSYFEALEALKIRNKLSETNSVILYDNLGIYRLLGETINTNELEQFYNETVERLVSFDRQNNAELIKTLEVFFECDSNINQASKQLFVHYNTVVQRLQRIESISNLSMKSPEDKLSLQVGLKIRNLLSKVNLDTK